MEGTQGITIESAVKIPEGMAMPKPLEPLGVRLAAQKKETSALDSDKPSGETKEHSDENYGGTTSAAFETEAADQMSPLEQKDKELKKLVEGLEDHMDDETKERLITFDEALGFLNDADDKEKKGKFSDTLAEMIRLMAILAALIALLVFKNKDTYSGQDLDLSDDPPEGKESEIMA